jgi:hypothetical protein
MNNVLCVPPPTGKEYYIQLTGQLSCVFLNYCFLPSLQRNPLYMPSFLYDNLAMQGWRSSVASCGRESSVYSKKLQNFPSPGPILIASLKKKIVNRLPFSLELS